MKERFELLEPRARRANLANVDERLRTSRGLVEAVGNTVAKLEAELEKRRTAAHGLRTAKMSRGDFDAMQKQLSAALKAAEAELDRLTEQIRVADEDLRAIERGLGNLEAGLDEAGADSDGQ